MKQSIADAISALEEAIRKADEAEIQYRQRLLMDGIERALRLLRTSE